MASVFLLIPKLVALGTTERDSHFFRSLHRPVSSLDKVDEGRNVAEVFSRYNTTQKARTAVVRVAQVGKVSRISVIRRILRRTGDGKKKGEDNIIPGTKNQSLYTWYIILYVQSTWYGTILFIVGTAVCYYSSTTYYCCTNCYVRDCSINCCRTGRN